MLPLRVAAGGCVRPKLRLPVSSSTIQRVLSLSTKTASSCFPTCFAAFQHLNTDDSKRFLGSSSNNNKQPPTPSRRKSSSRGGGGFSNSREDGDDEVPDAAQKGGSSNDSSEGKRNNGDNPSTRSSSSHSRFRNKRTKEWKKGGNKGRTPDHPERKNGSHRSLIQPTGYLYDPRKPRSNQHDNNSDNDTSYPYLVLRSLNAAALLDPKSFCKESSKTTHTHGVNRSISGTDAARRLLRGKKEFLVTARSIRSSQPVVLEGHGVPVQLFQHCINMADALLGEYGDDIAACTFHNYHHNTDGDENNSSDNDNNTMLPLVVRTRSGRDSKNRCHPWPPPSPGADATHDWDYHLTLYLTVMTRLVSNLGMVLQQGGRRRNNNNNEGTNVSQQNFAPKNTIMDDEDRSDDDYTASPLLFPNCSPNPQFNVDILRGAYYDLKHENDDQEEGWSFSENEIPIHDIPVLPIVEFKRGDSSMSKTSSSTDGHVLVRLQGYPTRRNEFQQNQSFEEHSQQQQNFQNSPPRPVSLVFDACFRSTPSYMQQNI